MQRREEEQTELEDGNQRWTEQKPGRFRASGVRMDLWENKARSTYIFFYFATLLSKKHTKRTIKMGLTNKCTKI